MTDGIPGDGDDEIENLLNDVTSNYHNHPTCYGGTDHTWIPTGRERRIYASTNTADEIPDSAPTDREEKCFCGAVRWVSC